MLLLGHSENKFPKTVVRRAGAAKTATMQAMTNSTTQVQERHGDAPEMGPHSTVPGEVRQGDEVFQLWLDGFASGRKIVPLGLLAPGTGSQLRSWNAFRLKWWAYTHPGTRADVGVLAALGPASGAGAGEQKPAAGDTDSTSESDSRPRSSGKLRLPVKVLPPPAAVYGTGGYREHHHGAARRQPARKKRGMWGWTKDLFGRG
ncbi:hypothetical protein BJY01DRAFT_254469 [Aspergillus pseudoustus]|uniref:Uncharacterized protein n=1 Tax=Aspergillus pseudoustus TaxID=1810923 RepID=A0ABR4IT68_9EURO